MGALPFFRANPSQGLCKGSCSQPTLNPYSPSYRVAGWSTYKNPLTVPAARNSEEHVLSLVASRVCPCSYLPIYDKYIMSVGCGSLVIYLVVSTYLHPLSGVSSHSLQ